MLERFCKYDDVWWLNIMRTKLRNDVDLKDDPWLNLICARKRGPRSLWKRIELFPYKENIVDWNKSISDWKHGNALEEWDRKVRHLEEQGVLVIRHRFEPWSEVPESPESSEQTPSPSEIEVGDSSAREERRKKAQSYLRIRDPHSSEPPLPATELSPIIASLMDTWNADVQVQAFVKSKEKENEMNPKSVLDKLTDKEVS
jgi:hypothetical protein